MLFRVHSAAVFGIKAYPIAVEVDLSTGQKLNLMTVGLPDTAVRESSERVKAALRNWVTSCPLSESRSMSRLPT
jgi:magnesium chelatase family protein